MWCGWYFNYSISLSSFPQLHLIIVYYPWLFMLDYQVGFQGFSGSLPEATNEAENWELISYWAEKTPSLLKPTELDFTLGYTWQLYSRLSYFVGVVSHKKKRNDDADLPSGYCDPAVNAALSLWRTELTTAVQAMGFTAESLSSSTFIVALMTLHPHTLMYICPHTPTHSHTRTQIYQSILIHVHTHIHQQRHRSYCL